MVDPTKKQSLLHLHHFNSGPAPIPQKNQSTGNYLPILKLSTLLQIRKELLITPLRMHCAYWNLSLHEKWF